MSDHAQAHAISTKVRLRFLMFPLALKLFQSGTCDVRADINASGIDPHN